MIIGIGCDIVKINRLLKNSDEIAKKVLSDEELVTYFKYELKRKMEFLAGRFAAKEALYKANNKLGKFSDINIYLENKQLKCDIEDYKVYISISHEEDYAIAYCIIEEAL